MNRDNQAGKVNTLYWVAGFFDGEGYIGLWKRGDQKKDTHSKRIYRVQVCIANTDEKTINHLVKVLNENGVGTYINKQTPKNKNWRPFWMVQIVGFKRVSSFINLIGDLCVTKKDQVALVKEFIDRRSAVYKNVPYIERDHEIYEQLKLLKRI